MYLTQEVARLLTEEREKSKKVGYLLAMADIRDEIQFFPVMSKKRILSILDRLEKEIK